MEAGAGGRIKEEEGREEGRVKKAAIHPSPELRPSISNLAVMLMFAFNCWFVCCLVLPFRASIRQEDGGFFVVTAIYISSRLPPSFLLLLLSPFSFHSLGLLRFLCES